MKCVLSFYCSILFATCGQGLCQELNQVCSTSNRLLGRCVRRSDCPSLEQPENVYGNGEVNNLFPDITLCRRMEERHEMLVCCPVLKNSVGCGTTGKIEVGNRIHGGSETTPDLHPWAALLMYSKSRARVSPVCAGSLINDQYVLTAAHCVASRDWKLVHVRLSEWDISDERNCTEVHNDIICKQEFKLQKVIIHESYDRRSKQYANDIALLQLSEKVVFGKFVKPICLPLATTFQRMVIENDEFTVVGWGETERKLRSEKQLVTTLLGKHRSICNELFRDQGIELSHLQLCVGGDDGNDSCRGDSGGPLMKQILGVWYLIGMVSFGKGECGLKNQPAVYTNVEPYLDWIENALL